MASSAKTSKGPKAKGAKRSKLKGLHVPRIVVHIAASFNNTKITVTNPEGEKISSSSAGACGFRGARKSTPYAAQIAVETAIKLAKELGASTAEIKVKGPGSGRESAIRAVGAEMYVTAIKDVTPIPHNGVRGKKKRRC